MENRFSELSPEEQLTLHHALVVLMTHPRYNSESDPLVSLLMEELWALQAIRCEEERAKELV